MSSQHLGSSLIDKEYVICAESERRSENRGGSIPPLPPGGAIPGSAVIHSGGLYLSCDPGLYEANFWPPSTSIHFSTLLFWQYCGRPIRAGRAPSSESVSWPTPGPRSQWSFITWTIRWGIFVFSPVAIWASRIRTGLNQRHLASQIKTNGRCARIFRASRSRAS